MRIPSWAVALCGSFLVVVSTVLGTVVLKKLDTDIEKISRDISQREAHIQRTLDSIRLADQKAERADLLAALIAKDQTHGERKFIIPRTAASILGAICTMRSSYEDITICGDDEMTMPETNSEDGRIETVSMDKIALLVNEFKSGNLNAYDTLVSVLAIERFSSAAKLNEEREHISKLENQRSRIRSRSKTYGIIQVSLNLLGLVIVLLKDLPVWRDTRPVARTS